MSQSPKTLTAEESERLLRQLQSLHGRLDGSRKAVRNYTMALLMLDAGLRVGEVVKLLQMDLWFNDEPVTSLVIPAAITKTKLQRIVPLSERLRNALAEYHKKHPEILYGVRNNFAFEGYLIGHPMTTRQVERIIKAAAIAAIGRPVNPHVLRHTFASRLMRVTNVRTVQQLLGHKQLSSTQIYTHPNAEDLKTAIAKISDGSAPNS